jgi:hypothetical protein
MVIFYHVDDVDVEIVRVLHERRNFTAIFEKQKSLKCALRKCYKPYMDSLFLKVLQSRLVLLWTTINFILIQMRISDSLQ